MTHPSATTGDFTLKGWLTSLLFWLAVLAAAGMYALVALSPKLLAWQEERERWRKNQERLVRLERRVDDLKQVANALESDPEFAGELARVELNASRPGDERLPVAAPLALAEEQHHTRKAQAIAAPWYEPPLREFAEDAPRRRWTLLTAAGLVVFAFTFLKATPARNPRCEESSSDQPWLKRRYGGNHRAS